MLTINATILLKLLDSLDIASLTYGRLIFLPVNKSYKWQIDFSYYVYFNLQPSSRDAGTCTLRS